MPSATLVIRLLFAIQLVSMGAMEMSGPFWPLRLRELTSSDAVFGITGVGVYIAPMLGIALTGAIWGRLGDRWGHRVMMVRALAGLALTQLALAFATDVWTIVALRLVQGACAGFPAPAQAYGVSIVPLESRGRLFAFLQVSTNGGSLIGAVVGGTILDHMSFFWINAAAATLCAACAVAVYALLPPTAPEHNEVCIQISGSSASVWRNPAIVGLLVAHGFLLASRMMPQMPFSLYVLATFHVENWIVGLCYGLMATGFIASAALWARALETFSRARTLSWIAGVGAACALTALVVGMTTSIVVFAAAYFVWGVLLGATGPVITALISRLAADGSQGHLLGVVQSTTQASAIAGIMLGGLVDQAMGPTIVFPAVAVMYVISCLLVLRARQMETIDGPRTLEGHVT